MMLQKYKLNWTTGDMDEDESGDWYLDCEVDAKIAALEAECERLRGDVENTARDWDSLRMTIQGAYGLLSREVNWGTRSLSVKRAYAMLLDALPTVEICGDKTDESEADDASS